MELVIITGMSGAGKRTALQIFEDFGYYTIDNAPPSLIEMMMTMVAGTKKRKIAFGIDIRSGKLLNDLLPTLSKLKERKIKYTMLFLDASTKVLITRFKENRREHPLSNGAQLETYIEKERDKLELLKKRADLVLDTSDTLVKQFREQILELFIKETEFVPISITLLTFGFRKGVPEDADLVMDVRFMPNPYYIKELRPLTGNDKAVQDFVLKDESSHIFMNKFIDLLDFLLPEYIKEGKNRLVVAIGCTGGRHRSVTAANIVYAHLIKTHKNAILLHRDINSYVEE